jgi:hypothetical protein
MQNSKKTVTGGFNDVMGHIGSDLASKLYTQAGGSGNPFYYDPGEGMGQYLGASQAVHGGLVDPSLFNQYNYQWDKTGYGNTGQLRAFDNTGSQVFSGKQKDTPSSQRLLEGLALGTAAFGGLGLMGAGPLSGLSSGMGSLGSGAASSAGTLMPEGAGALFGSTGVGGAGTGALTGGAGALTGGALGGGAATAGGGLGSIFSKAAGALGGKLNTGNILSGLAQMYSGNRQRKDARRLYESINQSMGPDSDYAKVLRQQLERRDSASGRRSQYGPRETELLAKLAEMRNNNAGTLASLMGGQQTGRNSMLQAGLMLGKETGINDIFGNMAKSIGTEFANELRGSDFWKGLFGS